MASPATPALATAQTAYSPNNNIKMTTEKLMEHFKCFVWEMK